MLQYPRLIIFIFSYLISEQRLNWFEDSSSAEVESESHHVVVSCNVPDPILNSIRRMSVQTKLRRTELFVDLESESGGRLEAAEKGVLLDLEICSGLMHFNLTRGCLDQIGIIVSSFYPEYQDSKYSFFASVSESLF